MSVISCSQFWWIVALLILLQEQSGQNNVEDFALLTPLYTIEHDVQI